MISWSLQFFYLLKLRDLLVLKVFNFELKLFILFSITIKWSNERFYVNHFLELTVLIRLLALACHTLNFFYCDCSFLNIARKNFNLFRLSRFIIIKWRTLILLIKLVHINILLTLCLFFMIAIWEIWWFDVVEKMIFELIIILL